MRDGLAIKGIDLKRRRRHLLAGVLGALAAASFATAAPDPVVVLFDNHRREVLPVTRGPVEMLPIGTVLEGLGVVTHSDVAAGSVTYTYQGRELALYHNKSLASVAGDLRLLSAPSVLEDGRWLVPIDGLPRLLGYLPVSYTHLTLPTNREV